MILKKILHRLKENRVVVDSVVIFMVAVILIIPNFLQNTDIYFDDGCQHLLRGYGAYQAITNKENTRVISHFANGFGYSWDLFYGPLSEYCLIGLGIIFHSFNVGFKILLLLIMFLAGACLYKLVYCMTDNRNTALLAGIIYITTPYFFTDIYVRHALGECMAFVFVPMVFLGLYHLFNTEKNHYYLVLGVAGLLLSHNIATVLTAILALIYCIINAKNFSRSRVQKGLLLDILWIVLLTSFYWAPFLQTQFSAEYRVFEKDAMATQESLLESLLSAKDLFITPNDTPYVFEIGLPVILMLAFSLVTFRVLKENKKEYLFFLISGMLSIWMSTKYFPWKLLPSQCYIIQFPWRMLLFSSFFFAIVASMNMSTLIKKFRRRDVFVIGLICMMYVFSRYSCIPYAEEVPEVTEYELAAISGQENEWIPGMGRMEYLPSKAYDNLFYVATRQPGISVLEGECNLQNETKMRNSMSVQIATSGEKVVLELPYLYYPGYTVKLDGVPLDSFETEKGFLGSKIDENEVGTLEVKYTGTRIMNLTKIISFVTLIVFLIYIYKKH